MSHTHWNTSYNKVSKMLKELPLCGTSTLPSGQHLPHPVGHGVDRLIDQQCLSTQMLNINNIQCIFLKDNNKSKHNFYYCVFHAKGLF